MNIDRKRSEVKRTNASRQSARFTNPNAGENPMSSKMTMNLLAAAVLTAVTLALATTAPARAYTLGVAKDTSIFSSHPNASGGTDDRIYLFEGFKTDRGLVDFEALPAGIVGSHIDSAILRLEVQQSFSADVNVRALSQSWTEGTSGNPGVGAADWVELF